MSNLIVYLVPSTLVVILVTGYLKPYLELRNTGLSFSPGEYFTRFIRKDILPSQHNKRVFQLAKLVSENSLNITLSELQEIHQAGGDMNEFVNAHLITKQKNLKISKTDIKTLILSDKNLTDLLNTKEEGEEVNAINELI